MNYGGWQDDPNGFERLIQRPLTRWLRLRNFMRGILRLLLYALLFAACGVAMYVGAWFGA